MRETGSRADARQRNGESSTGDAGRHQCPLEVPESSANRFGRLWRRGAADPVRQPGNGIPVPLPEALLKAAQNVIFVRRSHWSSGCCCFR